MPVTLADPHKWNLDHVLLSESLFDALSISRDALGLSDEEDDRGEDGGVLDLLLFLLLGGLGHLFLVVVNRDAFWNIGDL